jgi:hypothetical protein
MKWFLKILFTVLIFNSRAYSQATTPSNKLASSIGMQSPKSPSYQYYSMLLKILEAKDFKEIQSFYSKQLEAKYSKIPNVLETAKLQSTLLLGTPYEFIEEHVEGLVTVIKLSNRRFVKLDSSKIKTVGKNILSVYYQLLVKEEGMWRIDKTKEISNFAEPDKTAKEMLPTLLQFNTETEVPKPQPQQVQPQQAQPSEAQTQQPTL